MKEIIIDNNIVVDAPIIDILNRLKIELTNGKLRDIEVRGDEIRVTCPTHKDGHENKPSCNIYIGDTNRNVSYGYYHCFTCNSKGPLYHLVAECLNKGDAFGKYWLTKNFGRSIHNNSIKLPKIQLPRTETPKFLDESILDSFQSYHPYMDARKLNRATCEKFKIKYDPLTQCIVFPVWDTKNRLSFLTRRSVNSRAFIIDKDANKSVIYLLNYIVNENIDTAVVCEGQINALTCWQYGLPAIALMGAGTTEAQIGTLNKSHIKHYILAYDNDQAGDKGRQRFHKYIREDVFVDDVYMPLGKDINDLTQEEFSILFDKFIV